MKLEKILNRNKIDVTFVNKHMKLLLIERKVYVI